MTPFLHVLLDASIRISIVTLAVWLALTAGRIRSGSLRNIAWLAVICAMPLMLILPHAVPAIHIPIFNIPAASEPVPLIPVPAARVTPADLSPTDLNPSEISPAQMPQAQKTRVPGWPDALLYIYALGIAFLLWRWLLGWRTMRRILRSSRRISLGNLPVYESDLVAAPVTVGMTKHKILLPAEWIRWPEDKLCAVLAHESEHVNRRDMIAAMLAHLNRSFFWFHPAAWWLERQLAISAEEACDDAGVRAIGENRRYAQILLDMAEAVRRQGSLLSFHGAGVHGTGLLGLRINRLLRERPFSQVSKIRKTLMALGCAAVIFLVAACQEKEIYTRELKPDPEVSLQLSKRREVEAARNMTAQQVADLEAVIKRDPEDLETRRKLMTFYQSSGRKVLGDEQTTQSFWAHKLWLIKHHPENALGSMIHPLWSAEGHEQAKKLWLIHIEPKDAPVAVLLNAAEFFRDGNPQLVDKIILRVQEAKPDQNWSSQLGRLYASVLAKDGAHGSFRQEILRKMEESRDPILLSSVGYDLAISRWGDSRDAAALGKSYLDRAQRLDPNSTAAKSGLEYLQKAQEGTRMRQIAKTEASDQQYRTVSALPEAERFQYLPSLAQSAYIQGDMKEYYKNDLPGARKDWELARRYAQDALRFAPHFQGTSNYANAMYGANMVLGMVAMRVDGDLKAATRYLLAASKAPAADSSMIYLMTRLPITLLKHGGPEQRKAVIEYLERYGRTFNRPDFDLLKSAEQLRAGYMPVWYQWQSAALK